MKRVISDLKRVWRNPLVLASIALLFAAGGITGSQSLSPIALQAGKSIQLAISYTYSSGFSFGIAVFGWEGQPVAGAQVNVSMTPSNSSGQVGQTIQAATNLSGLASAFDPVPAGNYTTTILVTGDGYRDSLATQVDSSEPGMARAAVGTFSIIETGTLTIVPELFVAFDYPNGTVPPGVQLLANYTDGKTGLAAHQNVTVGHLVGCPEMFDLNLPGFDRDNSTLVVSLEAGRQVLASSRFDPGAFSLVSFPQTALGMQFASAEASFSIFAPLTGILIGYAVYGRERVAGYLEPLWATQPRPHRLLFRRLAAGTTAIVGGALVGALVFSYTAEMTVGSTIPASLVFGLWAGLLMIALAYQGLVVLLSTLSREPLVVLGSSAGVMVLLVLLWRPALALSRASGSGASVLVGANPSQILGDLVTWIASSASSAPPALVASQAHSLEIDLVVVLTWIAVMSMISAYVDWRRS